MVEVKDGQFIQPVAVLTTFEHVGQQHRVVDRRDGNAVPCEDVAVELDVLADLEDRVILQQRLQQRHRPLTRDLSRCGLQHIAGAMADRQVAGPPRRQRQRHACDLSPHRVERRGLGIEGDITLRSRRLDPAHQVCFVLHRLIACLDRGRLTLRDAIGGGRRRSRGGVRCG